MQPDDEPRPTTDQPRQALLAVAQSEAAEILTVELEEVEGVQHSLGDGAAAVQSVKDGDTIRTADHGLAIQSEGRGASFAAASLRPC
jgi:hypothetical protein